MCYYCFQGCDDFTHNFLRKLGVRIRNPENIPTDPYTDHRKKVCFQSDLNWVCHINMLSYKIPYLWFSTVIGLLCQNKPNLWCYCIFSSWWRACSHYVLMRKRTLSSSFFSLIAMCCDSSVFGMTVTGQFSLRFSVHWGCAYGIDSDIVMLETFSKYPIFSLTLFQYVW